MECSPALNCSPASSEAQPGGQSRTPADCSWQLAVVASIKHEESAWTAQPLSSQPPTLSALLPFTTTLRRSAPLRAPLETPPASPSSPSACAWTTACWRPPPISLRWQTPRARWWRTAPPPAPAGSSLAPSCSAWPPATPLRWVRDCLSGWLFACLFAWPPTTCNPLLRPLPECLDTKPWWACCLLLHHPHMPAKQVLLPLTLPTPALPFASAGRGVRGVHRERVQPVGRKLFTLALRPVPAECGDC